MILPARKTLSLAFVVFTAVAASPASGEKLALHVSKEPMEAPFRPCSAESSADPGLESRQLLIEESPTVRAMDPLNLRGAIILPPFPDFVPYRRWADSLPLAGTNETRSAKH